jgi:hypothetical protein
VDYIRALRSVAQDPSRRLVARRAACGGYAAQHADKINKVVLLAPAYSPKRIRHGAGDGPRQRRRVQHANACGLRCELGSGRFGCPGQVDPQARETVWTNMLDSDSVSARTWALAPAAHQTRRPGAGTRAMAAQA